MLQHRVKDELSNVALNNLNTCIQSCQDASQLIHESKSRLNETGFLDLSDDAILCLMDFLPLSEILKLRLLSKSVYTLVTNLCGNCQVWNISLPETFISSCGLQFDSQTRDYVINSSTSIRLKMEELEKFRSESVDLLDRC